MKAKKNEVFGLIKSLVDAHTMGIHAAAALLSECGYSVAIAPKSVEYAMERISAESNQRVILDWIKENNISHIGFSYRLDPDTGVELLGRLLHCLQANRYYDCSDAKVKSVFFAGLTPACEQIKSLYDGHVATFRGGESAEESLLVMGVPADDIPKQIIEGCRYDKELEKFGHEVINKGDYVTMKAPERNSYSEFGTMRDTVELRLDNNYKGLSQPLIRAHSGPYSDDKSRLACLKEFQNWCHKLSSAQLLDILSIGSSQLSQSNFGENWDNKPNGGGVPVNSELEYRDIWQAARPMLVRTYSGTSNIKRLAGIYEKSINICWHALSFWWFNELDGRGPNSLYQNLKEHVETVKYIKTTGKPIEANVPHHFAFRGADDITYIVSGYLAAKLVKKCGIKTFILQNMLNTPRSTWGVQDIAKSRTLLKLVRELEDVNFRVILQTRAGLDYFKPDIETAKAQLAAVTALMDDIEPDNSKSPDIIHVVSYSEALYLATPDILNDSIRITRDALNKYRDLKKQRLTSNVMTDEILKRQHQLEYSCRMIIKEMEKNIQNLYSPEGFYLAFIAGWLPVPELWSNSEEFIHAKEWETKMVNGGVALSKKNVLVSTDARIDRCVNNMNDAEYILKHKYLI